MDNLVTRLLFVPTLVKDANSYETIETSAMIAPCEREGCSNRGGHGGRNGYP